MDFSVCLVSMYLYLGFLFARILTIRIFLIRKKFYEDLLLLFMTRKWVYLLYEFLLL